MIVVPLVQFLKLFCTTIMVVTLSMSRLGDAKHENNLQGITTNGESIVFKVYYTLGGAYIAAGEASFKTSYELLDNFPVYHITALGNTLPFYDHFYKVRDRYESYIDTLSLLPRKFIRSVSEGKYQKFEQVAFNQEGNTAITNSGVYRVPSSVHDIISAIFYTRSIDYTQLNEGDKIPFTLFLDHELFSMYVRYMGKEKIKTQYGVFNAIKVKPLLLKGADFNGGEKMTVWISDDVNRLPVRIESEISVGSIKADLIKFEALRAPLKSLVDKN